MIGFLANRVTRFVLEELLEVEHDTAKWIGRGVGVATGIAFGDPSGAFDLPDSDIDADND